MTILVEASKNLLRRLTARAAGLLDRSDDHTSQPEVINPITFEELVARHAFPFELNTESDYASIDNSQYVADYLNYVGEYVTPDNAISPLVSYVDGVGNVLSLSIKYGPKQKTERTEHVLRLSGTQHGEALNPQELQAALDELVNRNIIDVGIADYLFLVHGTAHEQSLAVQAYRFRFDRGRGATLADMSPWIAEMNGHDNADTVIGNIIRMANHVRGQTTVVDIETNPQTNRRTAILKVLTDPEDESKGYLYKIPLLDETNHDTGNFFHKKDLNEALEFFTQSGLITSEIKLGLMDEFFHDSIDPAESSWSNSGEELNFLTRKLQLPSEADLQLEFDLFTRKRLAAPQIYTLKRYPDIANGLYSYTVEVELSQNSYRDVKKDENVQFAITWDDQTRLEVVKAYLRYVDKHEDDEIRNCYPQNEGKYTPVSEIHGAVPEIVRSANTGRILLILPYGYSQIAHTAAFESSATLHHQTIIKVMRRCLRGIEEELRTNP